MSRCDDWAEGWEEGRQEGEADMLAKCIAAVDTVPPIAQHVDDNGMISLVYDKWEILDALRALSGNDSVPDPASEEKP